MLQEGTIVDGRYRILCEVGGNAAMSEYDAEDLQAEGLVALKVVKSLAPLGEQERVRIDEIQALLQSFQHPNFVCVERVLVHEERPVLLVERVRGERLFLRIDRHAVAGPKEVAEIAKQVLVGLQALHARGFLHRDIRPGTLLCQVGEDGQTRYRVMHLGVLTFLRIFVGERATTGGYLRRYASPELLRGEPIDERTDLYSLGASLWACLKGSAPFSEYQDESKIVRTMEKIEHLPLSKRDGPRALTDFIKRLTAVDRDARFASATDALAYWEEHLAVYAAMDDEDEEDPFETISKVVHKLVGAHPPSEPHKRSRALALVLALVFGPFGLLYVSVAASFLVLAPSLLVLMRFGPKTIPFAWVFSVIFALLLTRGGGYPGE